MKLIGVMSKISDETIDITFQNRQYQTYTLNGATLDILQYDTLYPVHFVGFSGVHFIVVYTQPDAIAPNYISTGGFKGEFMETFIKLLRE